MANKDKITYTADLIANIIEGKLLCGKNNRVVKHILLDSRKITIPPDSVFIAIPGEHHDGHDFIRDLNQRGVKNFIVSDKKAVKQVQQNTSVILCDSTVSALHKLAKFHRSRFKIPMIAITGSNGKTIVKEWLFQMLAPEMNIVRSPKSYNSQVGVPLSVWQLNSTHDLGIFEAGISMPGEMKRLEKILKPTIGIFTNIGDAHSINFKSLVEKAAEKMELFHHVDLLIYCRDHELIRQSVVPGIKTFSWSQSDSGADLYLKKLTNSDDSCYIVLVYSGNERTIHLPFTDRASVENVIHVLCACICLGLDFAVACRRVQSLERVAMRLQMRGAINHCTLINDSYNSDIGSLEIALEMLTAQKQHQKKTVILSDILQTGIEEKELYRLVSEMFHSKQISRLIGVGKNISASKDAFNLPEQHYYPDTDAFIADFKKLHFSDETILIKGARIFGFERIAHLLEQQSHRTVMEIDLDALVHNLNFFRSKLKRNTKIMAMVKAFSYGSGSHEIASVLEFNRIDYLAVAYPDEGVLLRDAGISCPIMVMSPEDDSMEAMISAKLEPEISGFGILEKLIYVLESSSEKLPVHIKLDTGMHRLGFKESDISRLIQLLNDFGDKIRVCSVFTHLAASDDAKQEQFTLQQIALFKTMTAALKKGLNYDFLRHVLNTSGVLHYPQHQFDMVRIGIGLYGVGHKELLPLGSLKTKVIQLRHVKEGETIGYGRTGKTNKDMQLATVAIGYADGFHRILGNGKGHLLIRGKLLPVVGNVCMDMCMVDVTGMDVHEDEDVVVFGTGRSIEQYAEEFGTIPYEVLTSVSSRVKRVYCRV